MCIYIYTHIYISINSIYKNIHTSIICMCIYIYIYVYICIHLPRIYVYIHISTVSIHICNVNPTIRSGQIIEVPLSKSSTLINGIFDKPSIWGYPIYGTPHIYICMYVYIYIYIICNMYVIYIYIYIVNK